ncbi:uncharacterized protein TNCV_4237151 [Trichonephila clavipes]|nr:uncharacterized protein TNCV_4237151 [Trichonephila clavipes]
MHDSHASQIPSSNQSSSCHPADRKNPLLSCPTSKFCQDMGLRTVLQSRCPKENAYSTIIKVNYRLLVHYFVRGGFVGHRSRASSKHLSSHLPVDGVRFLVGQNGVALQLQDAPVGVGSNKDADDSRCSEN